MAAFNALLFRAVLKTPAICQQNMRPLYTMLYFLAAFGVVTTGSVVTNQNDMHNTTTDSSHARALHWGLHWGGAKDQGVHIAPCAAVSPLPRTGER